MRKLWRAISTNPIYLREKGALGEPNPTFEKINRFSPFVIIGAFILGICYTSTYMSTLSSDTYLLLMLGCLPNFITQALTWFGFMMVPALTAPTISAERERGTWDMLRLTPQPTWFIITAKLFGALNRLKIWKPLLIFTLIQAAAFFFLSMFALANNQFFDMPFNSILLWNSITNIGIAIRPWTELGFIALTGLVISTTTKSGRLALIATYAIALLAKIFNGSWLWIIITGALMNVNNLGMGLMPFAMGNIITSFIYLGMCGTAVLILFHRADTILTQATEM